MEFLKPTKPRPVQPQPAAPPSRSSHPTDARPRRRTSSRLRCYIRKLAPIIHNRKYLIIAATATVALAIIITGIVLATRQSESPAEPKFQTILPADKTIEQLGGWRILHPPESDTVYEYSDTLDGIAINVVEQALPHDFIEDVDKGVSDLAKKFNATDQIQAGSTRVYLGVSSKGPQSIIFAKNGLLILIRSSEAISNQSWQKYITSLQ